MSGALVKGESFIAGIYSRSSFVNTLLYCSRRASAFARSVGKTQFFQNKVGVPVDSVRRSLRYEHARLAPLTIEELDVEAGLILPMTSAKYLLWASRTRLTVALRRRLYAIRSLGLPVRLAFL